MRARRREAAWNGPWDVFLNCLKARGVNKSILRLSKHVIKSVRSFVELVWQELLSWSQFQFFVSEWRWCVSRDVIYSLMVPYKYNTHLLNVYTRTRVAPLTNSLCWMSFVIKPNQRLFLDVLYSSLRTSSSTAEDNPTCQILVTQSTGSPISWKFRNKRNTWFILVLVCLYSLAVVSGRYEWFWAIFVICVVSL